MASTSIHNPATRQRERRSKGVHKAWKRYLADVNNGSGRNSEHFRFDRNDNFSCTNWDDDDDGAADYVVGSAAMWYSTYEEEEDYSVYNDVKTKLVLSNLKLNPCDVDYLIKAWKGLCRRTRWEDNKQKDSSSGDKKSTWSPLSLEKIVVHQCSSSCSSTSLRRQLTAYALVRLFQSVGPTLSTVEFHQDDIHTSGFRLDQECFTILLHGLTKVPNVRSLSICGFDLRETAIGLAIKDMLSCAPSGCNLQRLSLYMCGTDINFIRGISGGLSVLPGLKQLDLRDWIYLQDQGLEILVDALTQSRSKATLCEFLLSGSRLLTPHAWLSIARLLYECSSLETLCMFACTCMGTGIGSQHNPGYLRFIQALRNHTSLLDLDMGYVPLHDCGGFDPLWKALEDNRILKRLRIYGLGSYDSLARSIAHMKGLESLYLDYPLSNEEEKELTKELWKNTSLMQVESVILQAPGRCMLNRNKCLKETIPRILANKESLDAATWPVLVERLSNNTVSGDCVYSSASAVYSFLVASSSLLVSIVHERNNAPSSLFSSSNISGRLGRKKENNCFACLRDPLLVWFQSHILPQPPHPKFSFC